MSRLYFQQVEMQLGVSVFLRLQVERSGSRQATFLLGSTILI
jgi:hypothetical protein